MGNRERTSARQYELATRRGLILEEVKTRRSMTFKEIYDLFPRNSVSAPTIRADINAIAGLLPVVKNERGGLQVHDNLIFKRDTYFGANLELKREAKDHIARYLIDGKLEAADEPPAEDNPPYPDYPLIKLRGDTVVVGPGTSTLAVLGILAERPGVETLTTNLGILDQVPDFITKPFLHFSGGWVLSPVASLVGAAAVRNINAFGANTAIIGVSGFCMAGPDKDSDIILYCHQEAQLPVKRALVENRKKVVVVTCGEKIGVRDAHEFSSVGRILQYADFYVFTDQISAELRKQLTSRMEELQEEGHKACIIELPPKEARPDH
jgi:DeoR/GlpR family transcriptional regulator of sugar metabolism